MSVLVISDIHVGSKWALWYPNFSYRGEAIPQNSVQKQLWKYWLNFGSKIRNRKYDAIMLLGENIDGTSPNEGGRDQKTVDLKAQKENCILVLDAVLNKHQSTPKYVFTGSDYHKSIIRNVMEIDEEIADHLPNGRFVEVGPWDYPLGGKTISFNHGLRGGSYWYRGTRLDKIGFAAQLAEAGKGWRHKDAIVWGHQHFRAWLEYEHQIIAVSPCWQVQTDYMRKLDPYKTIPDLGSMELWVESGILQHYFYSYKHPERNLITSIDVAEDGVEYSPKSWDVSKEILTKLREQA